MVYLDFKHNLGGGFKYFLFSPLSVEMIQFDYFSNGLKPPTSNGLSGRSWTNKKKSALSGGGGCASL